MDNIYCAWCNAPYTREMLDVYNGTYGCDSGCEYYSIVVACTSCKREVYVEQGFGSYNNEKEKEEMKNSVSDAEIKNALESPEER